MTQHQAPVPPDQGDSALTRLVDPLLLSQLGREGIINHVERSPKGKLTRSVSVVLIEAPLETVVAAIERVRSSQGGFLRQINMIKDFRILEDHGSRLLVHIDMCYRFFVLSFGFPIVAEVVTDGRGRMDLRSLSGKVKDLAITFRLLPADRDGQTLFAVSLYYDIRSLGWLVDYFLRHHPEIELGVFSATAPVIALALKEHIEGPSGLS